MALGPFIRRIHVAARILIDIRARFEVRRTWILRPLLTLGELANHVVDARLHGLGGLFGVERLGFNGLDGRASRVHADPEPVTHHLATLGGQLAVLAERRQLAQIAQAEEIEELLGGSIEDGPAHVLLLAQDADQRPIHEQAQCGRRIDTANLVDLGPRDRLAVRDDRERLELSTRQTDRSARDQLLHPGGELRVGTELVAARDLLQRDATIREIDGQRGECLLEPLDVADARELAQALERDRLVRGEDQCLDQVLELELVHRARRGRQRRGELQIFLAWLDLGLGGAQLGLRLGAHHRGLELLLVDLRGLLRSDLGLLELGTYLGREHVLVAVGRGLEHVGSDDRFVGRRCVGGNVCLDRRDLDITHRVATFATAPRSARLRLVGRRDLGVDLGIGGTARQNVGGRGCLGADLVTARRRGAGRALVVTSRHRLGGSVEHHLLARGRWGPGERLVGGLGKGVGILMRSAALGEDLLGDSLVGSLVFCALSAHEDLGAAARHAVRGQPLIAWGADTTGSRRCGGPTARPVRGDRPPRAGCRSPRARRRRDHPRHARAG